MYFCVLLYIGPALCNMAISQKRIFSLASYFFVFRYWFPKQTGDRVCITFFLYSKFSLTIYRILSFPVFVVFALSLVISKLPLFFYKERTNFIMPQILRAYIELAYVWLTSMSVGRSPCIVRSHWVQILCGSIKLLLQFSV